MSKKYGLILADKAKPKQPIFQATKNVFGEDSDSEEESKRKPLLRPSHNINRLAKQTQEKAVIEDPTVYQYDEIYDSMTCKKNEEKIKTKEIKKPKYIENLLKTAAKRKIENERRVERQVQKERENEGDEFADKEIFVTTAYKKKLEEMRQEEEKEKREEYLENIGDVTKQADLGGFYRHLYEQKLGPGKNDGVKSEPEPETPGLKEDNIISIPKNEKIKSKDKKDSKSRNYRKRKTLDNNPELSEGEIEETDDEINRHNLDDIRASKKAKQDNADNIDADSDFSVDDPSSSDNDHEADEEKPSVNELEKLRGSDEILVETTKTEDHEKPGLGKKENKEEKLSDAKPKIDIWKKRTVGEIFELALTRYYERKSSRGY